MKKTKKQQVLDLYKVEVKKHLTYGEIAKKAKCAKSYVFKVLKKEGLI